MILRADANVELGTGHLMRLLAIAHEAREKGGKPLFALGRGSVGAQLVTERRFEWREVDAATGSSEDVSATAHLARETQAPAVVCDGYDFGAEYYRSLKGSLGPGRVSAIVDDLGQVELAGDLVVNPNYGAEVLPNRASPSMVRLLGPRYALIRPEIVTARLERERKDGSLLVTFGGADHTDSTSRVLPALAGTTRRILLVLGSANPRREEIAARVRGNPRFEVHRSVRDMGALFRRAEAAVSAAGQTLWELAAFGVPTLAFAVAENQIPAAEALARDGLIAYGGRADRLDQSALEAKVGSFLTEEGRWKDLGSRFGALVDGKGAGRVVEAIASIATQKGNR